MLVTKGPNFFSMLNFAINNGPSCVVMKYFNTLNRGRFHTPCFFVSFHCRNVIAENLISVGMHNCIYVKVLETADRELAGKY